MKGWGCGYRTLQTICSWVRHVLKSKREVPLVPSLREIQQTLVDIGDKPSSFIGSREWIGSVEACLYMDETFGVGLTGPDKRVVKSIAGCWQKSPSQLATLLA